MSRLNEDDKLKFEELFDMESGYVMDFSNRSFKDFVYKAVDINIFDDKYMGASGSKANRLRKLWEVESNVLVAKLNLKLLEYWKSQNANAGFELNDLYKECIRGCDILKQAPSEPEPPKPKPPEPEVPKPRPSEPEVPEPKPSKPEVPEPKPSKPEVQMA